jgi:hypothetical protein
MTIRNTLIRQASASNVFTASTGTEHAITTVIFCNTNQVYDAYLDVWVVPNGGVPQVGGTQILKSVYIPPTETFVMDTEKLILGSGDAMWAKVDTLDADNQVCATVSSVLI